MASTGLENTVNYRNMGFDSLPFRLAIKILQEYHVVEVLKHLEIEYQWARNTEKKSDIIERFQKNWYGYFKNDFTRKIFVLFFHFLFNEQYSSLGNLQFVVTDCLPSRSTITLIAHDFKSYKFVHSDVFTMDVMKKFPNLRRLESTLFHYMDFSYFNDTNKELEYLDITVDTEIDDEFIESINELNKHPKLKTLLLDFEIIGYSPNVDRYSYNIKLGNLQHLKLSTPIPVQCDFQYLENLKFLEVKYSTIHDSQLSNIVNMKKLETFIADKCTLQGGYYRLFEMEKIKKIVISKTFECTPLRNISRYPKDLKIVFFEYHLVSRDEGSSILRNLKAELEKRFPEIHFKVAYIDTTW